MNQFPEIIKGDPLQWDILTNMTMSSSSINFDLKAHNLVTDLKKEQLWVVKSNDGVHFNGQMTQGKEGKKVDA